jgi:hypothetical protein
MQSDHLLGDLGNQMYTTYPKIPEKRTGTPPASCCACAHPREPLQGQVISRQNIPKKTAETRLRMRAPKGTLRGHVYQHFVLLLY